MHIPDGYLSLQTSLPALGTMLPIWTLALKKLKQVLNTRQIPLLSLCAAFSFIIMMFNVPLGASSIHTVGAVFIAVLMGPWAACIAVSIALFIQALVFGDGGIIALGANCFNMAFAMPFAGYYVYRAIAGSSGISSRRSITGIFMGSYIGINVAALLTAVEFGIQPLLFKTADGVPQFGFYPLWVSVPVIMFEHLLVAGPIEGIVTTAAIAYLVKYSPQLFDKSSLNNGIKSRLFSTYKTYIIGIAVLVLLTPLGLVATGTAWGEWGVEEVKDMLGYVPAGLERLSQLWSAAIPDYSVPGLDGSFFRSSIGYIISAVAGVLLIFAVMLVSVKFITKSEAKH